jgi:hypothetical protein
MTASAARIVTALTAAVVAASLTSGTGGASASTATRLQPAEVSVTGSARVAYPPSPDDEVRFTFDAHATVVPGHWPFPTAAQGRVKVSHRVAADNRTHWAEAEVDCLMTGGRTATLTAVVTKTSPALKDWTGVRLGFGVYDGGRDRAGRSHDRTGFSSPTERNLPRCMAPAPFAQVQQGGFTVKEAHLPR